ncbi:MAG: hypothetical protein OEY14_05585 [Myxococcales bacterium]|nr:hypothetical protein [Myxococcales bacterium]
MANADFIFPETLAALGADWLIDRVACEVLDPSAPRYDLLTQWLTKVTTHASFLERMEFVAPGLFGPVQSPGPREDLAGFELAHRRALLERAKESIYEVVLPVEGAYGPRTGDVATTLAFLKLARQKLAGSTAELPLAEVPLAMAVPSHRDDPVCDQGPVEIVVHVNLFHPGFYRGLHELRSALAREGLSTRLRLLQGMDMYRAGTSGAAQVLAAVWRLAPQRLLQLMAALARDSRAIYRGLYDRVLVEELGAGAIQAELESERHQQWATECMARLNIAGMPRVWPSFSIDRQVFIGLESIPRLCEAARALGAADAPRPSREDAQSPSQPIPFTPLTPADWQALLADLSPRMPPTPRASRSTLGIDTTEAIEMTAMHNASCLREWIHERAPETLRAQWERLEPLRDRPCSALAWQDPLQLVQDLSEKVQVGRVRLACDMHAERDPDQRQSTRDLNQLQLDLREALCRDSLESRWPAALHPSSPESGTRLAARALPSNLMDLIDHIPEPLAPHRTPIRDLLNRVQWLLIRGVSRIGRASLLGYELPRQLPELGFEWLESEAAWVRPSLRGEPERICERDLAGLEQRRRQLLSEIAARRICIEADPLRESPEHAATFRPHPASGMLAAQPDLRISLLADDAALLGPRPTEELRRLEALTDAAYPQFVRILLEGYRARLGGPPIDHATELRTRLLETLVQQTPPTDRLEVLRQLDQRYPGGPNPQGPLSEQDYAHALNPYLLLTVH